MPEREQVTRKLRGEEITVSYKGIPIQILVGRTVLEIGRPKDLDITEDPEPNKLNIISTVRLSETNGANGRIRLKDGGSAILGTGVPHGFRFSPDVSRLHVAIKSLGNKVVIKDLNSVIGTVVYTQESNPSKLT